MCSAAVKARRADRFSEDRRIGDDKNVTGSRIWLAFLSQMSMRDAIVPIRSRMVGPSRRSVAELLLALRKPLVPQRFH